MRIIDIGKAEIDLRALGADDTALELVLNNIRLYNSLVDDYELCGFEKNLYLTYQLNVQITKQFSELRKTALLDKRKVKEEEDDPLSDLINTLKEDKPNKPKPTKKKKE